MSVYVNTEVAEDSLLSDLMQCFLKTDFKDDKFPNISRRMKELKHGEEDEKMCKSVEEYAERKAKEAAKEAAQKAAKKATEEAAKKAMAEKKKTVEKLNDMGMDISLIASAVDMDEETIKHRNPYSGKYPARPENQAGKNHQRPRIPTICLWRRQVRNYGHSPLPRPLW